MNPPRAGGHSIYLWIGVVKFLAPEVIGVAMTGCKKRNSGLVVTAVASALALFHGMDAQARQINHREENEWTSTQKSALGNVGMLSENFVDQFFADPSLQARKKNKFDLQLTSLNTYFTEDFNRTQSDAQDLIKKLQESDSGESGLQKGVDVLEFIASLTGRRVEAGASIQILSTRIGRVTVVPHVNAFAKGNIDVPSWPEAAVIVDQYSSLGVGYSHPLGKSFDLGINVRPGFRVYLQQELSASTIEVAAGSSAEDEGGSATSFSPRMGLYLPIDLGLGYQVSSMVRANMVIRNAYGAAVSNMSPKTDSGEQPDAPPDYPVHLSLGGTWDIIDGKMNRLRMASDLQDLLHVEGLDDGLLRWQWALQYLYNLSFRDKTTVGLNAGLQSGYPSIGLLLDLFLVKLEGAYFVFEGGAAAGQDPVKAYSLRMFSEMSF